MFKFNQRVYGKLLVKNEVKSTCRSFSNTVSKNQDLVAVAPMVDVTDRHFRYLARLVSVSMNHII